MVQMCRPTLVNKCDTLYKFSVFLVPILNNTELSFPFVQYEMYAIMMLSEN